MEGVETSSHCLEHEVDLVVQCSVVEHHAASDQVGVAADVLCQRMGHDIGAEEKRVLVHGGHEGVVDNKESAVGFALFSNHRDIEDFESRVGGRLEPDHAGVGAQEFAERLRVAKVLEGDLNVGVGSKNLVEVTLGATVDIIDAKNMIALLTEVHESNVSGHSRAASEGVVGVLKRGQLALESETGGVAATSVVEDDGLTWGGLGVS